MRQILQNVSEAIDISSCRTKNILVVDDERDFRLSLGFALRRAGYIFTEAENGKNALSIILEAERKKIRFDLILLDMMMPEMSGSELIDALQAEGIHIPTIIISAYTNRNTTEKLYMQGYRLFLEKPFKPEDILNMINDALKETK